MINSIKFPKKFIIKSVNDNINLKKNILDQSKKIIFISKKIFKCLKKGGKIFICGNGGSASDAQHLAAEMMVRLNSNINRKPYPVISLALDVSTLTAISNDYGFSHIYERTFDALAKKKDLLIVISTSGNSENIIKVLKKSRQKKIFSIALLGNKGGLCKNLSDLQFVVPSDDVARIQEVHIFLGHVILNLVEANLLKQ